MLFGAKTATEKRAKFRKKLASGELLQMPGAHEPIIARIIEEQGIRWCLYFRWCFIGRDGDA